MKSRALLYTVLSVIGLAAAVTLGYFVGRSNTWESAPATRVSEPTVGMKAPAQDESAELKKLPPAEQAARAFRAVFGAASGITLKSGDNQELTEFRTGKLVWAPLGPVFLSEGTVVDPSHASAGQLAVAYLQPHGDTFRVEKKFIPAIERGSTGTIAEWSVSSNVGPNPVVYVEGGGTWQGYTCGTATLLELALAKPTELVDIPVYYSDAGAIIDNKKPTEIQGKILDVVKGQSFDVVYTGSRRFTDHYVRRGDRYVLQGGHSQMEEC